MSFASYKILRTAPSSIASTSPLTTETQRVHRLSTAPAVIIFRYSNYVTLFFFPYKPKSSFIGHFCQCFNIKMNRYFLSLLLRMNFYHFIITFYFSYFVNDEIRFYYIHYNWLISLVARVFTNGPGDLGSYQRL